MIADETPIVKGRHLATVSKLIKEYSVQLEVLPTRFLSKAGTSVLHFTTGLKNGKYGSRTPGIWFSRNIKGGLFLVSPISGINNYVYKSRAFTPNQWIKINVSQTKIKDDYIYKVAVNGKEVQKVKNTKPEDFEDVKVYVANPWHTAQEGYVRNVSIKGNIVLIVFCKVRFVLFTCILPFTKEHLNNFDIMI